ncbi:MAG: hypothetical protein A2487_00810 [Candidatus Raymondbacteria bacterium RifOxyC12_full_50_8]|uniref:Response regulatory domain-containing protein n=1 Tax=Candidatus Raymondbacteria bacterium RIFOXYD12_FULL_49_13 TaxID=1817890 RepID=A0A1F7F9J5_UNCRA|nr:MAG: hypothetical protein A2350_03275 [Candidatus Raymondbacteria bacterium RifOxyB12_full_50_8]OGJ93267.1 MAG: hypothetical protein A2248_18030 [Candidatus Raymondbacteria bacterium RIFOXYA2_FULL_49_16]OGJ98172.1 MAG: hypothetical protein A2487_00810 [Candidatus Raymondbacteria bacterium RifOxyC12_full_50_8]OGK03349.1 MAG: hypothetical protein A2519_15375 [Candidatus Raymondbacteria bacterium RIFOXYD12_FULL_49_13]OGP44989.1 MAG: hypothetical protein A2324_19955 [Candidatus Raymondbacteria b
MVSEKTVLLIDDEEKALDILRLTLEASGFTVFAAQTGYEGLVLAEDQNPSAIVLDIRMPALDGWGVFRQLKENPITAGIPVVILSAFSGREYRQKAEDMGAYLYITKPVDPRKLIAWLFAAITA